MTKQTFKVGDKVRIISTEGQPLMGFKDGDIVKVTDTYNRGGEQRYEVLRNDGTTGYGGNTTFELISDKPTKNQRISALESEVEALKAEVAALKAQPKPTEIAEMFAQAQLKAQKPKVLTPNEQRKAIIAEAKAFVEDVTKRMKEYGHGNKLGKHGEITTGARGWILKAEFVVNPEKRTVVALARPYYMSKVVGKAIAKCAPDDVFNADIGKAIALGRALGLDVKRFEQAVKPTEVVVGHIVTFPKSDSWYMRHNYRVDSLTKTEGLTVVYNEIAGLDCRLGGTASMYGAYTLDTIIDDTEAQY